MHGLLQRLVLDCIEVVCDLGVVGAELIQHIADIKHVLRCQLDLAVNLLKEREVDVKLSSSLTRANQKDMARIIDLGEELGIPVRVDTYMMPAVRERN